MLRAVRLGDESQFVGQNCALCKQAFGAGDDIVICPEDGSRHHVHCWHANGDKCTAYGCRGAGAIGAGSPIITGVVGSTPPGTDEDPRRSRVRPAPPRPHVIDQVPETAQPTTSATTPPPSRARVPVGHLPVAHVPVGQTGQSGGPPPGSKVRVLPQRSTGCAGGCLVFFVILAVFLLASSCFALYTVVNMVIERVGPIGSLLPDAVTVLGPLFRSITASLV